MSFTQIDLKDCKAGSLYVERDMGAFCLILAKEDAKNDGKETSCLMRIIGDIDHDGKITPRKGNKDKTILYMYNNKYKHYGPKIYSYEA